MTRHELMQANPLPPAPRSLADLDPLDDIWPEHVEWNAFGHRSIDRLTSVCGVPILQWPIAVGHLMTLCGRLCPYCWSPAPTETPADPGR